MSDATTTDREASHRLLKWKRDIIYRSSPAVSGNSENEAIHLIVLAMLRMNTHLPRFGDSATVGDDGLVRTVRYESIAAGVLIWRGVTLKSVEVCNDALRRLADHCKLSDTDRQAMFKAFADWISHDARANDKHGERVH